MNRAKLRHILMESGLCVDRVRWLDWILKRDWRKIVAFRYLRFRYSPAILEDVRRLPCDAAERGRLFSVGLSHVNVGDTYKTTSRDRTTLADQELVSLSSGFERPTLLDVGASDGSSALTLLEREVFVHVKLTDRFSHFMKRGFPCGAVFYDSEGRLLGVKFLCFYLNLALTKTFSQDGCERIETINPLLEGYGVGRIETMDIFTGSVEFPVCLIKCANVLQASYFTDEQVRSAVENLKRSLVDGGCLVISHNNIKYADGEAVIVMRRKGEALEIEKSLNDHELGSVFEGMA